MAVRDPRNQYELSNENVCICAVDEDGTETIFDAMPERYQGQWTPIGLSGNFIIVPEGTIKRVTSREMTWKDNPRRFELSTEY